MHVAGSGRYRASTHLRSGEVLAIAMQTAKLKSRPHLQSRNVHLEVQEPLGSRTFLPTLRTLMRVSYRGWTLMQRNEGRSNHGKVEITVRDLWRLSSDSPGNLTWTPHPDAPVLECLDCRHSESEGQLKYRLHTRIY